MLKTRQNIIRRIILRFASEVTKLAIPIDTYLVSKSDISEKIEFPPVFIVGAPRTGSTLIYQVITNFFDVKYISNFSASFYHSLYAGMIIEEYLLGNSAPNMFDSNYGMARGPKGHNECGQFWYRWFPGDRHFIAKHEYSIEELSGIRKTISAISKKFGKPLIFKNLNNGQRLQIIKKILPESLIIFVQRDPVYAAQSILVGRLDYYGDKNSWFSVMPKNMADLEQKGYAEQVVKQVYYLEKQIVKDLKQFFDGQYINIQYESFCDNTQGELKMIEKLFRENKVSIDKRNNSVIPRFKIDKEQLVSDNDFRSIQKECKKLSWEKRKPV